MLEQIDLTKKMTKEAYQEGIDSLKERLAGLQRECRSHFRRIRVTNPYYSYRNTKEI